MKPLWSTHMMHLRGRALAVALAFPALLTPGCASGPAAAGTQAGPGPAAAGAQPAPAAGQGLVPEGTAAAENIALSRTGKQTQLFAWQEWTKEAFERARKEGRFLLLDGAAEWCHWCHVMDETTYLDPEVGQVLRDRFVAIRVDVDQRPDVAERYAAWGWPATVIFTPDAQEIGKFRGYLAPERMREILRDAMAAAKGGGKPGPAERQALVPAPLAALPWIAARTLIDLDNRYDEDEGGWGQRQKYPIGANLEVELLRKAHGDEEAGKRAVFTLRKQRALIDRVWGGMYQYSMEGVWDKPHFEKLMPVQAAAIEAYARGYAATQEAAFLLDAQIIFKYLQDFLSNRDGAFLVSQDADVNAHDRKAAFVDGHVFYARDDAGRRALGMPRIDDHVYARENGLALAALCTLYEVTHDEVVLARAKKTADLMLRTHLDPDGSVRREAVAASPVRYLADAAALGRGLARLAEVTRQPAYRAAAQRVAQAMLRNFSVKPEGPARGQDAPGQGALVANTKDPAATGVFAQRHRPFNHNVVAARFLLALSRATGDASLKKRATTILAAAATPRAIDDEGKMIGEFLLALAEAGAVAW